MTFCDIVSQLKVTTAAFNHVRDKMIIEHCVFLYKNNQTTVYGWVAAQIRQWVTSTMACALRWVIWLRDLILIHFYLQCHVRRTLFGYFLDTSAKQFNLSINFYSNPFFFSFIKGGSANAIPHSQKFYGTLSLFGPVMRVSFNWVCNVKASSHGQCLLDHTVPPVR